MFYDLYESDGSDPKWFVGTIQAAGTRDDLKSRTEAIRKARKILGYGYKVHTKLSDAATFVKYGLVEETT
jgi:hypothetical protein